MYAALQNLSKSLVTKFGGDVSVTNADGKRVRTKGVLTTQQKADETGVNSSLMAQTGLDSKVVIVPGTISIVPQVGDTVTVGSAIFKVDGVETVNPGGTTLIYKLAVT